MSSNKIRVFLVTSAMAASYIDIGLYTAGAQHIHGTFTIVKIGVAEANHIGKHCIYYRIGFREYYENALGVTVEGAETKVNSGLFIPAYIDLASETFNDNYMMIYGGTQKFLQDSLRGSMPFKKLIGQEYRVLFVSDEIYLRLYLNTTIRGNVALSPVTLNVGYGFVVINEVSCYGAEYFFTADTANTSFWMRSLHGAESACSEALTITQITKCYPDARAVEFAGRKGLETIIFRGEKSIKNKVEKQFYQNINAINIPFGQVRKKMLILRSIFELDGYVDILFQLIQSDKDVWLFNSIAANYKVIGIKTDEITEYDKNDLLLHEIEAEYI